MDLILQNSRIDDLFRKNVSGIHETYIDEFFKYLFAQKYKEKLLEQPEENLSYQFFSDSYVGMEDILNSAKEKDFVEKLYIRGSVADFDAFMGDYPMDGYEELNSSLRPINAYLSSRIRHKVRVFINKELHAVIVLLDCQPTDNLLSGLFASYIRIWDWAFVETENEIEIARLFHDNDIGTAVKKMDAYCEKFNYLSRLNEVALQKYSLITIQNRIRDAERRIEDNYSSIRNCDAHIDDYLRSKQNYYDTILELNGSVEALKKAMKEKVDKAVPDFFGSHKCIDICEVNAERQYITFFITETIEYYDLDDLKRIIDNERYTWFSDQPDYIKKLIIALFINEKGKILARSEWEMRNLTTLSPRHNGDITHENNGYYRTYCYSHYQDCFPHPHLCFYNCLGGNETQITKYLQQGEWDMAIEQGISATKNLRFGDSSVCSSMCEYMQQHVDTPFILADNGTKMTINEFLDYCYPKENQNEQTGDENNEQEN